MQSESISNFTDTFLSFSITIYIDILSEKQDFYNE